MITQQKRPMSGPAGAPARRAFCKEKARFPVLISLLLALATVAVYWSVAKHDFVDYDDSDYVSANAHVQGGLKLENVTWAFGTGHASNWHPLTWLSHMLDWQLFGNRVGAFHLVNLAFHVANTLVLFLVLNADVGSIVAQRVGGRAICVASSPRGIRGLDFRAQGLVEHTVFPAHTGGVRSLH